MTLCSNYLIGVRHRGRLFKIRDTGARVPKNLDESRFGNPREVQMDDRNFEQELASARLTVEDLARWRSLRRRSVYAFARVIRARRKS